MVVATVGSIVAPLVPFVGISVVVVIVVVHVAVFVTYSTRLPLARLCCCSLFSFVQKFSAALGWLHKFLNNQQTDTTYGAARGAVEKWSTRERSTRALRAL